MDKNEPRTLAEAHSMVVKASEPQPDLDEETRVLRAIMRLDLESTRAELVRRGTFSEEQVEEVERCYREHLYLMVWHPNLRPVAPSDQVGEFWHTHILETEKYAADCDALCGRMLHHRFEPMPGTHAYVANARFWRGMMDGVKCPPPDWFTYTGGAR